jgi:hypothetical protein
LCCRWKEGRVRRIAHSLALLLVLVTFVACQSPIDTADSTNASGLTPTSQGIRPPDFTLHAKSSSQPAIQGAYHWQLENGRVSVNVSNDFSVTGVTPLTVIQGDELSVTASNGTYPEKMDLKIYPEAGNLKNVKSSTGTNQAFVPSTNPLTSQSFSNAPYDLMIELPTGHYFIWMSGTWPNPSTGAATASGTPQPAPPSTDTIAFWIAVQ